MKNRGADCTIVVTQPRRISAITVAERVAAERAEDIGNSVGYSVRFETVLPRAYGAIQFCTVGVLLRKLEQGLRGISHVIVDEIHERDINVSFWSFCALLTMETLQTDFILIILRDMMRVHKNLRVVLMSATVDTTMFSQFFDNCASVVLEGTKSEKKTFFFKFA